MPDCDYCGASFDSEEAEIEHLRDEHGNELGPIDQRRVGVTDDGDGFPTGPVALGFVLVAAFAVVGYVIFVAGSGAASDGPTDVGSVHYHGTINVTVEGETVDFSQPEYQRPQEHPAFHFEDGEGGRWHVHGQGVTLQYAMETLDIEVTEDTVTFDGTTYRDGDEGTTVVVEVNDQPVDPSEYVLQRGDHIRIVVERS